MSTTTKIERGKTQIEISVETRRKLRLLAAFTDQGLAETADDAITRQLAAVQGLMTREKAYDKWICVNGKSLGEVAADAYDRWIAGKAGPAFAGDTAVRTGFIDGFIAALVMTQDEPRDAIAYAQKEGGFVKLIVTDETAQDFTNGERYKITYRNAP